MKNNLWEEQKDFQGISKTEIKGFEFYTIIISKQECKYRSGLGLSK